MMTWKRLVELAKASDRHEYRPEARYSPEMIIKGKTYAVARFQDCTIIRYDKGIEFPFVTNMTVQDAAKLLGLEDGR